MFRLGEPTLDLGCSGIEREPRVRAHVRRARIGGALGVLSVALLVASFVWAHHWGVAAVVLVAGWALATIGALLVSVWSLSTTDAGRRFAKMGIASTVVSMLALLLVGTLYAAGMDAAGACGGG